MALFTDWLTKNKRGIAEPSDKDLGDYYSSYIERGRPIATPTMPPSSTGGPVNGGSGGAGGGYSITKAGQMGYSSGTTTGGMMTNSTGTTSTWGDKWTHKEKEALAKIGCHYDEKTNEWVLKVSAEIRIEQLEGVQALMGGVNVNPTKCMIDKIKSLRHRMNEKLTAKIILAELVKPREIK